MKCHLHQNLLFKKLFLLNQFLEDFTDILQPYLGLPMASEDSGVVGEILLVSAQPEDCSSSNQNNKCPLQRDFSAKH